MLRLVKVKPPHGWNAVGWELAIVTLGVLIALGAQQLVENLHDRSTAAETRRVITNELNSSLMSLELRERAERCIERRLAEVRGYLINGRQRDRFKRLSGLRKVP